MILTPYSWDSHNQFHPRIHYPLPFPLLKNPGDVISMPHPFSDSLSVIYSHYEHITALVNGLIILPPRADHVFATEAHI